MKNFIEGFNSTLKELFNKKIDSQYNTPQSSPSVSPRKKIQQLPLAKILKETPFLTAGLVKDIVSGDLKVAPDNISLSSLEQLPILTLLQTLLRAENKVGEFMGSKDYKNILLTVAEILEDSFFMSKNLSSFNLNVEDTIFLKTAPDFAIMKGDCTIGAGRTEFGKYCSEIQTRFSNFLRNLDTDTEPQEKEKLKKLLEQQAEILQHKVSSADFKEELKIKIQNQVDKIEKEKKEKKEKKETILEKLWKQNIIKSDLLLVDAYFSFFGSLYALIKIICDTDENIAKDLEQTQKELGSFQSGQKKKKNFEKTKKESDSFTIKLTKDESFFVGTTEEINYSQDNSPYIYTFSNGITSMMQKTHDLIEKTKNQTEAYNFFVSFASFLDPIDKKRPKLNEKDAGKSRKSHNNLKAIQEEIRGFDSKVEPFRKYK